MGTQYSARYQGKDGLRIVDVRTRYYATREQAQDALMVRSGPFTHLGKVAGDVSEDGVCTAAPRNGGQVSIITREVK